MKTILALLLLGAPQAFAANPTATEIEVVVQHVFVPSVGFDSNDEVEITIDGMIPNYCYMMGRSETSFDAQKKVFTLKQFAMPRNILQCLEKDPTAGNDYLATPYAFARTLRIGQLSAGQYTIRHKNSDTSVAERKFKVDAASTEAIDDLPYAPVTSAFIPEIVEETSRGEVILTGVFDSTCVDLGEVTVQRLDDVFVILPKLKVSDEQNCVIEKRPLQKIVNIGELKEGQYLLHVRSQSGLAVNRTFSVIKKKHDRRGAAPQ
jgi:hypothetical protein